MNVKDFKNEAEKNRKYIIDFRRDLHMHPELSGEEVRTGRRIAEELGALGIPFVRDGKGNIVGKITGTRTCDMYRDHSDNAAGACGIGVSGIGNKTIAIRGDFDAIPVKEETGLSFASLNDGVMHACGHDAHAAGVLGAAKMLKEHEADFAGTVYVCFQMGEEIVEGAEEIIEYLESEGGVDRMAGIHVIGDDPCGVYTVHAGLFWPGKIAWTIKVKGKGGHGSTPWKCIDPLQMAAEIILRTGDLEKEQEKIELGYTVSACLLEGCIAPNIVPDEVAIRGTIRYFEDEQLEAALYAMKNITAEIAEKYGGEACFFNTGDHCPVVNDADAVSDAEAICRELDLKVKAKVGMPASDNFGTMLARFPGVYVLSGCARKDGKPVSNHNPHFDVDEDAVIANAAFLAAYAYKFLSE